jgi:hypothetical protein
LSVNIQTKKRLRPLTDNPTIAPDFASSGYVGYLWKEEK